jgi:hypothetical protein
LIGRLLEQVAIPELDRRYRAFVGTLPPRLARLANQRRLAAGDGPSIPLQTVAQIGIAISGPWAFRDTFPNLAEEQLLDLGEAWIFLILSVVLRDHLADGQWTVNPDTLELQRRLTAQAHNIFRASLGDCAIFWQRFEHYEQQVVSALRLEAHYRTMPSEPYGLAAAWHIGAGKSALFKTIPCAMAALCEAMTCLAPIESSIDALAAGRQLLDDIVDWNEDLARGHWTYPLARAMEHLDHIRKTGENISPEAIRTCISDSAILEGALAHIYVWYHQALAQVEGIPCQAWTDFIRYSIAECTWYHRWLIIWRISQAARAQGPSV